MRLLTGAEFLNRFSPSLAGCLLVVGPDLSLALISLFFVRLKPVCDSYRIFYTPRWFQNG